MPDLLIYAAVLLVGVMLGLQATRLLLPPWRPGGDLTFEAVCRAAAAAKGERRAEENLTHDYVDGADAVMGELVKWGYCESSEEMEKAWKASGEEVELEP